MTCDTITVNQLDSISDVQIWLPAFHSSPREQFVFLHPVWQRTWWEIFGGQKEELLFSVESKGHFLLGVPMYIANRTAQFIGGEDLTDYHDFLYGSGSTSDTVCSALTLIARRNGVDKIVLSSIPENSPTIDAAKAAAEVMNCRIDVEEEDVAPRLQLTENWDSYLSLLSKKHRHELRRKLRRIEAAGTLKFVELSDCSAISEGMEDFIALHKMSTPHKKEFMDPLREQFFHRIATSMAEVGAARLCFTEFDGERVATSLSFVSRGTKYLYNSGYNPDYRDLSVGLINHAMNIRSSIEEGFNVFDFLRGNERYKYELGGGDRRIMRIHIYVKDLISR